MDINHFYKKTIVVAIFILAGAIMTYIDFNEVSAQSSGNQSASSGNPSGPAVPYSPGPHSNPQLNTPYNQSKIFPNNTETIKSFDKLNGNNTQFFSKDKSVSNPNNSLANSLGTANFQNH
ncbi:MAG: hypothetical protein ABJB76_10490 [Candidatus Nitrosocosmicus sp.]